MAGVITGIVRILRARGLSLALGGIFSAAWMASCAGPAPAPSPHPNLTPSPQPTATATTRPTPAPTPLPATQNPTATAAGPWDGYTGPTLPAPTGIPSPVAGLDIPEEVQAALLAGTDRPAAFGGRTQALLLIFFNPRTAKASLVSLPPNLYLYIPGFTMQRVNVAYPLGGMDLLVQTLQYNLGIKPSWWAVAHQDDFPALIDDLGGLDVSVVFPLQTSSCTFRSGRVHMSGAQALCYASSLVKDDQSDRQRRLEEIARLGFLRLVTGGRLSQLDELYKRYNGSIQTNLGLSDLKAFVPLALKLGDAGRVGYYQLGKNETRAWALPESEGTVLLPNPQALRGLLQEAVDAVSVPAPLTDRVGTLEFELTQSPTPTQTVVPTRTPVPTRTVAPTPTGRPTLTASPTRSVTPATATPSPTGAGT